MSFSFIPREEGCGLSVSTVEDINAHISLDNVVGVMHAV